MPKVSVIIPFYNGESWLIDAVDSVLQQDYDDIEIIVINDGSPESLTGFLEKYGNKIVYLYQENQGVAVARNKGIDIATGDYIAFLDSDDIWLPQKLTKQIAFMEKIGAMWSHTGFYYWFSDSGVLKKIKNDDDCGDVSKKLYVSMKIATPSVIINRKVFDQHPDICFPVEFKNGEDTQLYRAIGNYYPLALIEEPLLKVRMRGDNSYKQALARFKTNSLAYLRYRKDPQVPILAKSIMLYYHLIYKLLGDNKTPVKEKVALVLWSVPYALERLYTKLLVLQNNNGKQYILKQ